jgi:hypothetical protein
VSLLVVGSVAFDAIKTPYGKTDKILGGAATYFSLSASFFTPVRVVAVVGEDFTKKEEDVFHARKTSAASRMKKDRASSGQASTART